MGELDLGLNEIKEKVIKETSSNVSNPKNKTKRVQINEDEILQELSAGKIDSNMALAFYLRTDIRVQFHSTIHKLVKTWASKRAIELGFENKDGRAQIKKYLYYLFRLDGMSIPDDELLDARVRKEK